MRYIPVMLFVALSAHAAPPVDAEGRWQHVITLEPSVLVWPHPADRIQDIAAVGIDPTGGLVLVGEGDVLGLTVGGALKRDAWGTPASYPWFRGHIVVDGAGLWGCDREVGVVQVRRDGSVSRLAEEGAEIGQGCELYRTYGGDFFAWSDLTSVVSIFDGDGVLMQQPKIPQYAKTGTTDGFSVAPCGALMDGTSLAMATTDAVDHLRVVTLDDDLKVVGTILDLDTRPGQLLREPLGIAESWLPRRCVVDGDTIGLAYWNQGLVLSRDGTVQSWLRNGTPLDAKSKPATGQGPWGFDGLNWLGTIDERTLVAVARRQGVQLYREALAEEPDLERAATLAVSGDFLGAEQHFAAWVAAHPDDLDAQVARLNTWIDAGWWGDVIVEGKRAGPDDPRFNAALRARSLSLSRWTRRRVSGGGTLFSKEKPDPRAQAREYLDELLPHADAADPEIQEAVLRLALAGRRPRTAHTALTRLEATGRKEPMMEAFWVYVDRGDLPTVEKLVKADPHPVLEAAVARLKGEPEKALSLLEGFDHPADELLRGEALFDLGRLDEALATWTRAAEAMPEHPTAHAGLGLTYLRRGLPELAVQSFLKSLEREENPVVRSNLVAAFAALDDRSGADAALEKLADDEPVARHQRKGAPSIGSKRGTLAVLPFDIVGGTHPRVGMGDLLSTLAVTELVGDGAKVVERARLDALLGELDLQASAYVAPGSAVQLGKLAGAKRMLLGNVAEFPGRVSIDVRMVDVKTGEVLKTASTEAPVDIEALRKAVKQVCSEVL